MPPTSGSNSSASTAAALAAAKAERTEKLRGALKVFILKERQRKREEFEAKMQEERLRKEREARERQNDMTLEETRGQIEKLEFKLTDLHNQKQQLFLQLKKVLHEDEVRKKQQKDNDIMASLHSQQSHQSNTPQPQIFLHPVRMQHHQLPLIAKTISNAPMKRGRSPSPTTQQSFYKSPTYSQPKAHAGYQNTGALLYHTANNASPLPHVTVQQPTADNRNSAIIYTPYNLPIRQGFHLELPTPAGVAVNSKGDVGAHKPHQVYHINLDQTPVNQSSGGLNANAAQLIKPQITMEKISERYQVDVKHEVGIKSAPVHGSIPPNQLTESVVYTPIIQGIQLHPNVVQISSPTSQNSKTSNIAQGYTAPQQQPPLGSVVAHDAQLARQPQLTVVPGSLNPSYSRLF